MLSLLKPHTLLSRLEYQVVFSAGKMADAIQSFEFTTGLRGFHLYSTTKHWKPYLQQKITFKREHNNVRDRFAVSGLVTLRGTLAHAVVGHVPKELSRYVWYAFEQGTKFTGRVISVKPKRSPLIQGGLEIPMVVSVQWSNARSLAILTGSKIGLKILEIKSAEINAALN